MKRRWNGAFRVAVRYLIGPLQGHSRDIIRGSRFPGRGSLNHSLARQLSPSSQARDAKHDKMAPAQPELKKVSLLATPGFRQLWRDFLIPDTSLVLVQYLDKRLFVQLNGSRKVIGVLRGYDVRPATFHPRTDRPYGS